MPKTHPLFLELAAFLRALARDVETEWSYSVPAQDEMICDRLDETDVVFTLQNGNITEGGTRGDIWEREYRVEEISDGVHIGLVVKFSVEEKWIEIVTAFRVR